jgi:hypothetical protein
MRSGVRRRPATSEFARETLTHVGAPPLTRVNPGQRPDPVRGIVTVADQRAAGESEAFRRQAMQERSLLTTTGAVAMTGRDPVWAGDAEEASAWALIMRLAGE